MTLNRERLAKMAKSRSEAAVQSAKYRRENREWLRMSHDIALTMHYYMAEEGMNRKAMAEKLGVSAVYVGKLLKGGENLTLETICKIQNVIGEIIVSVSKPYVQITALRTLPMADFSKNAVESDMYHENQYFHDSCVTMTGVAS